MPPVNLGAVLCFSFNVTCLPKTFGYSRMLRAGLKLENARLQIVKFNRFQPSTHLPSYVPDMYVFSKVACLHCGILRTSPILRYSPPTSPSALRTEKYLPYRQVNPVYPTLYSTQRRIRTETHNKWVFYTYFSIAGLNWLLEHLYFIIIQRLWDTSTPYAPMTFSIFVTPLRTFIASLFPEFVTLLHYHTRLFLH